MPGVKRIGGITGLLECGCLLGEVPFGALIEQTGLGIAGIFLQKLDPVAERFFRRPVHPTILVLPDLPVVLDSPIKKNAVAGAYASLAWCTTQRPRASSRCVETALTTWRRPMPEQLRAIVGVRNPAKHTRA